MSRRKKILVLMPFVVILFLFGYSRHKKLERQEETNMVGRMQSKAMNETSGLAASGIFPGIYYAHNDSGDTSRIFAIKPTGELKTTIYFTGNTHADVRGVHDCEDIAVGPGPVKGKSYVYLGDIGDNNSSRSSVTIYRMEEKKAWLKDSASNYDDKRAVQLRLKYPDGPKDAETLMLDPIDRLLYIVSKRQDSVTVYTTPLDYKDSARAVLTKRCKLFFPGYKLFKWITAGDISKDGQQVLLKNYVNVYYWRRENKEPIWKTLQRKAQSLPYVQEKQGEAIAFNPDATGYYTTSEGVYAPIFYFKTPAK